jgi:hypothetical protein
LPDKLHTLDAERFADRFEVGNVAFKAVVEIVGHGGASSTTLVITHDASVRSSE